jgi:hypothetical protein
VEELVRLERCERGLSEAYVRAGLVEEAALHRHHSELLRARIEALGGEVAEDPDDDWLWRRAAGDEALRLAEHESIAIYHDHLIDFDPETRAVVRDRILPEHERLLAAFDRSLGRSPEV